MIQATLLLLTLQCLPTVVINQTTNPWNNVDRKNFSIALYRCKTLYMDAPCLVKFIKKDIQNYHAVCGKKK